jgi:hypothetical protein
MLSLGRYGRKKVSKFKSAAEIKTFDGMIITVTLFYLTFIILGGRLPRRDFVKRGTPEKWMEPAPHTSGPSITNSAFFACYNYAADQILKDEFKTKKICGISDGDGGGMDQLYGHGAPPHGV